MTTLTKPTVGRKVWYRPSKHDLVGPLPMHISGSVEACTAQPLDATVVAVWGDRCVNVQVLDVTGKAFTKMSVTLKQPGDEMPKGEDGAEFGGYVEWMPYQVTQHAKAATEEAATAS